MRNTKIFLGIFFLTLLTFISCKDKEIKPADTFEKKDILTNLADNWIAPKYSDLDTQLDSLYSSWNAFKVSSTPSNFDIVKNNWKAAYLSFQNVKFIDFGPASINGFSGALGTFPSDSIAIENNILSGTYDLTSIGNISAIGFPALDYLLFRNNALVDIQNQINRKNYISDLIVKMTTEMAYIQSNWGTFRTTFIDGTGTSSTSPFSQLVNAFCKDFDLLKNSKVGIPLGKQSLGIQRLEYLEARYSKFGKELLAENLNALKNVFLGNSSTISGVGFDDYLIALDKANLSAEIETRLSFLSSEPSNWSSNLEQMMLNSTQTIDNYYVYMQNSIVYMKTDMSSAFGIMITYQDNDGD